jgi:hypothetical protein
MTMNDDEPMIQITANAWSELECRCCGGPNLHFNFVREFRRTMGEDSPSLQFDHINGKTAEGVACDKNPSSRRDAVRIYLMCEGCDIGSMFTLIQHKGCTYVRFEESDTLQPWSDDHL